MAETVLKIKLPETKRGLFNRVPTRLYSPGKGKKKLTPSAVSVAGKIYGFSHTNDPEAVCRLSYEQIREEFGFSRATIAGAIEQLCKAKKSERVKRDQDGTAYKYIEEIKGKRYDNIPQYLYTAEICVCGEWRKLTPSEIRLLAHITTACENKKTGGICRGSAGQFARDLGICKTTVKKALRALMKAGLIYRAKENKGKSKIERVKRDQDGTAYKYIEEHKGKSKYNLSGYEVNRAVYEYKKYLKKPRAKRGEKPFVSAEVAAANAKAERESYYAKLREEAQQRVDKYLLKANREPRFKEITGELSRMEIAQAKAEIFEPVTLPSLLIKKQALIKERREILKGLNMTEADLLPRYKCLKCSDTGFKPDGCQCNCYPKGGTT